MNSSAFQKLVAQCQSHKVFDTEWSMFSALDFAENILPDVTCLLAISGRMYDGINLFDQIKLVTTKAKQNYPFSLCFFAYTKGVEADNKKSRVTPGNSEICAFLELSQDEKMEISFAFGSEVKKYLYNNALNKTEISTLLNQKSFSSTLSELKAYFNHTLTYQNMIGLLGEVTGVELDRIGESFTTAFLSAAGVYYLPDGTKVGQIGSSSNVRVFKENITYKEAQEELNEVIKMYDRMSKPPYLTPNHRNQIQNPPIEYKILRISKDVGMSEEELNTRAFMSTLKQAENNMKSSLPYNAWNGIDRTTGKVYLFTKKSFNESPEDYKTHPGKRNGGGSAAGAYQIMFASWMDPWVGAEAYKVKDFSPLSQDKFIFLTIKYKLKAFECISNGNIDVTINKVATEWRALPGPKTQSKITVDDIKQAFIKNKSKELLGESDIETLKGELLKYEK